MNVNGSTQSSSEDVTFEVKHVAEEKSSLSQRGINAKTPGRVDLPQILMGEADPFHP